MRVWILRGLFSVALLIAVVWAIRSPEPESIIAVILGFAGLLSAGLADPGRPKNLREKPSLPGIPGSGEDPDQRSVAVLPLRNLSSDPEDEFFSDGITEDLITQLSQIGALKVISRTSCMVYKNKEMPLREIASELGVENVVEGSVRRDGDRLRIVAQLIDAKTDQHLWAETYDRELSDLFSIQSDVARRIAEALKARMTEGEDKRIDVAPTRDLEAYNLCLLGRHFWNRWTEGDIVRSTEFYAQALGRDPDYATAHCELGVAWATLALGYWSLRPLDVFPKAAASIRRAIELDPGLAQAHAWSGLVEQWFNLDWAAAEASFRRAIELDPNSANAHDSFGWWLTSLGRHEEAASRYARALELDPLSLFITCNAALGAYRARDYLRSVQLFERAISLDPNLPMGHGLSSLAYVKDGSPELALAAAERGDALSYGATPFLAMRAYALAACGEADRAREILAELERRRETENVWLFGIGMTQASLGEHDLAFETLDDAVQERVGWITYMGVEPGLDDIRGDPRFADLLEEVGLTAEVSGGSESP